MDQLLAWQAQMALAAVLTEQLPAPRPQEHLQLRPEVPAGQRPAQQADFPRGPRLLARWAARPVLEVVLVLLPLLPWRRLEEGPL